MGYDVKTLISEKGSEIDAYPGSDWNSAEYGDRGHQHRPHLLKAAEANDVSVGFYGGRPGTLELMTETLGRLYPQLKIGYCYSPPFRALEAREQKAQLEQIEAPGVQLLFVGLGSPKQERWMHQFSPSLSCVCLGVEAAFEFLSGKKVFPPVWIQQLGLTWFVRLCQEPRRLAKRNLYSPIFAAMFLRQNSARVEDVVRTYRPDTVYHAQPTSTFP